MKTHSLLNLAPRHEDVLGNGGMEREVSHQYKPTGEIIYNVYFPYEHLIPSLEISPSTSNALSELTVESHFRKVQPKSGNRFWSHLQCEGHITRREHVLWPASGSHRFSSFWVAPLSFMWLARESPPFKWITFAIRTILSDAMRETWVFHSFLPSFARSRTCSIPHWSLISWLITWSSFHSTHNLRELTSTVFLLQNLHLSLLYIIMAQMTYFYFNLK
jgi:hypothetical protein